MNVEIGTEAEQFPKKEYINGIFIAVFLAYQVSRLDLYDGANAKFSTDCGTHLHSPFSLSYSHLLATVWGQVEDKDGKEGDAHAGDDQVHRVEQRLPLNIITMSHHKYRL